MKMKKIDALLFQILFVALGGIGFWFIKNKGSKPCRNSAEPEYDDEEDEDDEIIE